MSRLDQQGTRAGHIGLRPQVVRLSTRASLQRELLDSHDLRLVAHGASQRVDQGLSLECSVECAVHSFFGPQYGQARLLTRRTRLGGCTADGASTSTAGEQRIREGDAHVPLRGSIARLTAETQQGTCEVEARDPGRLGYPVVRLRRLQRAARTLQLGVVRLGPFNQIGALVQF